MIRPMGDASDSSRSAERSASLAHMHRHPPRRSRIAIELRVENQAARSQGVSRYFVLRADRSKLCSGLVARTKGDRHADVGLSSQGRGRAETSAPRAPPSTIKHGAQPASALRNSRAGDDRPGAAGKAGEPITPPLRSEVHEMPDRIEQVDATLLNVGIHPGMHRIEVALGCSLRVASEDGDGRVLSVCAVTPR